MLTFLGLSLVTSAFSPAARKAEKLLSYTGELSCTQVAFVTVRVA